MYQRSVLHFEFLFVNFTPDFNMAFKTLPEPAAVYEIRLVAFNGNGDSIANKRLVSLAESGPSVKTGNGG